MTSSAQRDIIEAIHGLLESNSLNFSGDMVEVKDFKENPFSTTYGQEVASISESFIARKLREGRLDRSVSATTSYDGTLVAGTVRAATAGTVLYPTCFNITSDVVANGYFEITTGIASGDTIRRYFSLAEGEYKSIALPEGYYVLPSGTVKVYITATSATCSAEVEGVEVAYG
jgi:hypothetical protein